MASSENISRNNELCRRLQQLVFCPVCRDTFQDPKILGCGHSFCAPCIENVYHRSVHSNCFSCPVCRESAFPPENATSNFPNNTTIQGILEILEQEQKHYLQQECPCELCDSSCVQNVCMDCNVKMCCKCTVIHNKIEKVSHTVLSLSNIKGTPMLDIINEKEKQKCPIHGNVGKNTFCVTCNETVCGQCVNDHDQWHKLLPVEQAADGMKDFLALQIQKNGPEIQQLQHIIETLQDLHMTLDTTTKDANTKIRETTLQFKKIIAKMEEECISKVEEMRNTKSKVIQDLLETAEIQLVMRANLVEYMTSLHKYGTTALLAKNKKAVQDRLERLQEQSSEKIDVPNYSQFKINFLRNMHFFKMIKNTGIGRIQDSSEISFRESPKCNAVQTTVVHAEIEAKETYDFRKYVRFCRPRSTSINISSRGENSSSDIAIDTFRRCAVSNKYISSHKSTSSNVLPRHQSLPSNLHSFK